MARVFVLGLDALTPQLLFERYLDDLPTFRALMAQGAWGRLRSCDPPITVPAWTCMFSGRDPGELGLYGFRNRIDRRYDRLAIADSRAVSCKRAWDYASEAGLDVVVLGVPQTYPPSPVKGVMVADFLTPSKDSVFTYPPLVRWEIDELAGGEGGYIIDVEDFRTDDKPALRESIFEMTRRRFRVARTWVQKRPWSLFCMVEMGPDRLQHGFWRYCDPTHRLYTPGNPFADTLRDYYRLLDGELAALLDLLPADASLLVVSDHGARGMVGGICINEWLIDRGLLRLRHHPDEVTPLRLEDVIWRETKAWGEGGYYGRVFLNVAGREPEGCVDPSDVEALRTDLAEQLAAIADPDGAPIGTVVHRPEVLYRQANGLPPDLLVYFGDLAWRSVGSVGHRALHTFTNDTGPDDANHDHHGIFLGRDGRLAGRGELRDLSLYDLLPTILDRLGLPLPPGLVGHVL
jgi:predicted AlkP superfamily phosphohydrolase/phosphomutase